MTSTLQLEPTDCPLCGEPDSRPIVVAPDYLCEVPGIFQVVRCLRCSHAFLNPRPSEATIGLCYPSDYGPYHSPPPSADAAAPAPEKNPPRTAAPWYLSRPVRMIPGLRRLYYWLTDSRTEFIPPLPSNAARALDVGCASGDFLVRLRDAGWIAEGVELMPAPAARAAERGFSVHVGTLESAGFGDSEFEAVNASMVLEHVHDPGRLLDEIHRILTPQGWLVLTVPNFGCWERFAFRGYWRGLELPRHLQHYTPKRLRSLLEEHGFRQIEILHQRNLNNIVASCGLWLRRRRWGNTIGQRLIDFTDRPGLIGQLLLALPARVLALVRQGGRLTVIARREKDRHAE